MQEVNAATISLPVPAHDVSRASFAKERRGCLQSAERRWRLLDGAKLLPDVIQGIIFKDGIRLDQAAA
jgi:hypothetical protein